MAEESVSADTFTGTASERFPSGDRSEPFQGAAVRLTNDEAVLVVEPLEPLAEADQAAIAEEGARPIDFVAPEAGAQLVRFLPVAPGPPRPDQSAASRSREARDSR